MRENRILEWNAERPQFACARRKMNQKQMRLHRRDKENK